AERVLRPWFCRRWTVSMNGAGAIPAGSQRRHGCPGNRWSSEQSPQRRRSPRGLGPKVRPHRTVRALVDGALAVGSGAQRVEHGGRQRRRTAADASRQCRGDDRPGPGCGAGQAMSLMDGPKRRIVVGVDVSAGAQSLVRWADQQAIGREAVLSAVTVDDDPSAHAALAETVNAALPAERARLVKLRVSSGKPAAALLREARRAELLVFGAHSPGGISGLLLG